MGRAGLLSYAESFWSEIPYRHLCLSLISFLMCLENLGCLLPRAAALEVRCVSPSFSV